MVQLLLIKLCKQTFKDLFCKLVLFYSYFSSTIFILDIIIFFMGLLLQGGRHGFPLVNIKIILIMYPTFVLIKKSW